MTAQSLSKKSRDELNISLNILYRKLAYKGDPGSQEKNPQKTENNVDQDKKEEENQLSAAVGIGI